jgi:hypothetical protein
LSERPVKSVTAATLLGLLVSRRLALLTRLMAQRESRTLEVGDLRGFSSGWPC